MNNQLTPASGCKVSIAVQEDYFQLQGPFLHNSMLDFLSLYEYKINPLITRKWIIVSMMGVSLFIKTHPLHNIMEVIKENITDYTVSIAQVFY